MLRLESGSQIPKRYRKSDRGYKLCYLKDIVFPAWRWQPIISQAISLLQETDSAAKLQKTNTTYSIPRSTKQNGQPNRWSSRVCNTSEIPIRQIQKQNESCPNEQKSDASAFSRSRYGHYQNDRVHWDVEVAKHEDSVRHARYAFSELEKQRLMPNSSFLPHTFLCHNIADVQVCLPLHATPGSCTNCSQWWCLIRCITSHPAQAWDSDTYGSRTIFLSPKNTCMGERVSLSKMKNENISSVSGFWNFERSQLLTISIAFSVCFFLHDTVT